MGVAQIAGMAVVPLALVSRAAARVAGWVAHLGAAGLVRSADLVRFAPALTYRVAPPPWLAVALYYGALRRWWICGGARRRAGSARAAAAVARRVGDRRRVPRRSGSSPIRARSSRARGDGRLHVTFLDVGQGDSAFVVFPRGSTLLVDAGGLSAAVVASTSATASSRRSCATPASGGSTTSR